jgi:hypothetical protein
MIPIDDGFELDLPFDPLAEQDELPDEDEDVAFIGLIERPVEEDAPAEEPVRSPEERIRGLLDSIPAQRKVMLGIIDFCREPRPYAEVDDLTLELQKAHVSVYTPTILRQHMEEAGALAYVEQEGDAADTARVADAATAANTAVEGTGAADIAAAVVAESAGATDAAAAVVAADMVEDAADGLLTAEKLGSDEGLLQIEYLEVTKRPEGLWVSTPAACAIYDSLDYVGELRKVLDEEPEYAEIFVRILRYCAETPRTKPQLNDLVDNDPILLAPPRRYSGYFIERLDTCNALEWRTGGWVCTEVGRAFVKQGDDASDMKPAARLGEGE